MSEDKSIKIAKLIGLEKKTREAKTEDELNFVIVNETRQLVDYISSFLLLKSPTDSFVTKATSDLATVDRTSPLINYLERIINHKNYKDKKDIQSIDLEKISKSLKIKKPKNIPIHCVTVTFSFKIGPLKIFVKMGWRHTINADNVAVSPIE